MARTFLLNSSVAAIALAGTPTLAQSSTDEANAGPSETGLEVIVVTAQKRTENLQDVPVAISVLTASQLEEANIETAGDLTLVTPSLNFSQTAVFAQPYIRGVGTDSFSPGNEASVATYIDGVYLASMNASTFAFNNIERIEVLKGPQGTLYGRNSTGGLVNVITRTPDQSFQFEGDISYGNYDRVAGQAYIAGGLAPNLAMDLAVSFTDQGKGYYRNLGTGNRVSFEDGTFLRSKLVADFSPDVRLVVSGDYSDFRNTLANTRQPAPGTTPALPPGTFSLVPGDYYNTFDDLGTVEDWGVSGNLSADLGGIRVVSITAYRETQGDQYLDGDDSSRPFNDVFTKQDYWQFTQEIQLLSNSASRIQWIVGLFYLKSDAGWDPIDVFVNGARASSTRLFSASTSYAGFAQATVPIGADGRLTVGGRYTYDKKDYRRSFAPTGDVSESWERPTWRIAYDHRLSDDTLAYASYNRGYKSGVYNTLFGPPVAVDPEEVDAFEIGLKNELFDRRVRLNAAAFYTDFRDIQVRSQQPGNTAISLQNAAAARIYGIDADLAASIAAGLTLTAGISWLNARYTDFPLAELYIPRPTGGNALIVGDASGDPLPRTPEFSGNIGARYEYRMANDSRFYANANLFLSDDIYWAPGGRVRTDGYEVVNATVGYALPGDNFSIEMFAKNLTDTRYENYVVPSANADRTSYAPPRTYGVRLGYRF